MSSFVGRSSLLLATAWMFVGCDDSSKPRTVLARSNQLEVRRWQRARQPADEARQLLQLLPLVQQGGTIRLLAHVEGTGDEPVEPGPNVSAMAKERERRIRIEQNLLLQTIRVPPGPPTTILTTVPFVAFDANESTLRALARTVADGIPAPDGKRRRVHAEAVSTLKAARSSASCAQIKLEDLLARLDVGESAPRGDGRLICIIDTAADDRVATLTGRVKHRLRIGAGYPLGVEVLPTLTGNPPQVLDHGTQCACMATAAAPGAHIVSLAVDDGAHGYRFDDVLAALDWIVRMRMEGQAETLDVVSLSLSDPTQPSTETCGIDATQAACFAHHVENLGKLGVIVTVAAGNSMLAQAVTFPACVANALTVGATDGQFERRAQYSNWGDQVDIAAPGSDVLLPGWGYSLPSGTSVATPFAAGLIARLREKHPDASASLVVEALWSTGVGMGPSAITPPTPEEAVPEIRFDAASQWISDQPVP